MLYVFFFVFFDEVDSPSFTMEVTNRLVSFVKQNYFSVLFSQILNYICVDIHIMLPGVCQSKRK